MKILITGDAGFVVSTNQGYRYIQVNLLTYIKISFNIKNLNKKE